MKYTIKVLALAIFSWCFLAFNLQKPKTYNLTVKVSGVRSSEGVIQFALYNKDGSIPDKEFKKYFKLTKDKIIKGGAVATFTNLPRGNYAVNVLHDENLNGQIDKGLILPKEGIGFSNYKAINIKNQPDFKRAKFELSSDTTVVVKLIYF